MKKQRWFVSHASKGQQHTPAFFFALNQFQGTHPAIEVILPHGQQETMHLTREEIAKADLVLAEVSIASTGSGIELGWASAAGKRIIAFQQAGTQASPAIGFVTNDVHLYVTEEDIVGVLNSLA